MKINTNTNLYAVIGYPVSHSLSPAMHNHAFKHAALNNVYLAFETKDIKNTIAGIRALNIKGASITIPYKVSVIPYLDKIDEAAERIGAVNTIVNEDGNLTGYNTDSTGAVKALCKVTEIKNKKTTIVGSGGTARAIGFGILSEGGKLTIVNRTKENGEKLANVLGADFCPFDELENSNFDILINTTPVGMSPDIDSIPVNPQILTREKVVMDVVYNPLKTRLLNVAADTGCRTVSGAAMFIYQGASQFELWTGKKAPIEIMRNCVMDLLAKNHIEKSA